MMDATACSLIQTKELTFFHKANDDSLSVIISFLFKIQNSEMKHDTTIPGNNMICIIPQTTKNNKHASNSTLKNCNQREILNHNYHEPRVIRSQGSIVPILHQSKQTRSSQIPPIRVKGEMPNSNHLIHFRDCTKPKTKHAVSYSPTQTTTSQQKIIAVVFWIKREKAKKIIKLRNRG